MERESIAPEERPPPLLSSNSSAAAARTAPTPALRERPDEGAVAVPAADTGVSFVMKFRGSGPEPAWVDVDVALDGDHERMHRVACPRGRSVSPLPTATRYEVVRVVLDGWTSNQHFHKPFLPGEDGCVRIPVELPHRAVLEVVDARTGLPLPDAFALRVGQREDIMDGVPAPGPDRGEARRHEAGGDEAGRIALPPTSRVIAWWVCAPRFAWTRARPADGEAPLRVALSPAGGLRVEVEGWSVLDEPEVQASPIQGGRPDRLASVVLLRGECDGVLVADGLAPGRWHVAVGRSSGLWLEQEWAAAEAVVEAGQVAAVSLAPPALPGRARATLSGTLHVAAGWPTEELRVSLMGKDGDNSQVMLDADLEATERAGEWRFRASDLVAGTYELTVYPCGWCVYVAVTDALGPVRLELPPPAQLEARVLDAADAEPLAQAEVTVWHEPQPDASLPPVAEDGVRYSGGGDALEAQPEAGCHAILTYAARVRVAARAPGYAEEERVVRLAAGTATPRLEFRLQRVGQVRVRILDDGRVARSVAGFAEVAISSEEQHAVTGWHSMSAELVRGEVLFDSIRPGRYVVSCQLEDGARAPEVTVEVRRGETSSVDLALAPR